MSDQVSFSAGARQRCFFNAASDNPEPLRLVHAIERTPRYYQINAVRNCASYLAAGFRRLLIVQPTGTGKTFLARLVALDCGVREALGLASLDRPLRVLFIAGQARLLRQARDEFAGCKDVEFIAHSAFREVPEEVVRQGWDLTFIDEAHHEAMTSIQNLLAVIAGRPVFGLTATPERGDGLLLKFERYIYSITKSEAIRRRFISAPSVNSIIDTGATDKQAIAREITRLYYHEFGQTIVYFKTKQECRDYAAWCGGEGYSARCLLDDAGMDETLADFSAGRFRLLVNCQKLGEGVDIQGCTDVLLARQFHSPAEKEQYIGRAIRPDSPCTVWEFVNPLAANILAKTLFRVVRRHRLIFFRAHRWQEAVLEEQGVAVYDHAWLSSKRQPSPKTKACADNEAVPLSGKRQQEPSSLDKAAA